MQNLYEYYQEKRDSLYVNYYEIPGFSFDLDHINNDASEFIKNYCDYGMKGQLTIDIARLDEMRSQHSIIVFVLGTIIYFKALKKNNNRFIVCENEEFSFSYVWYLTSLIHDLGYVMEHDNKLLNFAKKLEENQDRPIKNNSYWKNSYTINRILNKYTSIKRCEKCKNHPVFRSSIKLNNHEEQRKHYNSIFRIYHETKMLNIDGYQILNRSRYRYITRCNYFRYGLRENSFINHGILGSVAYNRRLIQTYKCAYCEKLRESDQDLVDFNHFVLHERIFSNAILHVNKYISSVINDHNIWKSNEETNQLYQNYLLDELMDDNFSRISYENNPLLFILCIADTIEPVKVFKEYDMNIIYDFLIEVSDCQFNITVKDYLKSSYEWVAYKRRIIELMDWVDIDISIENDVISINF